LASRELRPAVLLVLMIVITTLKMMQRAENIAARNLKRMQRAQPLTSLATAR
jgi:hypothetical protein